MFASGTLCDCGKPATTEISVGWDSRNNCGAYAPVCETCYDDSNEADNFRYESSIRAAAARLGIVGGMIVLHGYGAHPRSAEILTEMGR